MHHSKRLNMLEMIRSHQQMDELAFGFTFAGETTRQNDLPLLKEVYTKRKEFAPRIDLFSEGDS